MSQTANQTPAPRAGWLRTALGWLCRTLLNNWPLKLLSLTIAIALWVGLITQDPTLTREKTFRDVTVSVNNVDILKRNGYIVVTDIHALLDDVTVTVDVPQTRYGEAAASNYNVRVDLNRLQYAEGMQELPILYTSTSTNGTVTRVNPPSITVQVEEYVSQSYIPVNVAETGETPEGFYLADVSRDPEWVTISGPRSLVEQVEQVRVTLDRSTLEAREGRIERALDYELLDGEGKPVVSDMLEVTRESVLRDRINVAVTLFPQKDVAIQNARLYTGTPAPGYTVTDVIVNPPVVSIAGSRSIINTADLLMTSRLVNVSGLTDSVSQEVELSRPLNLQWISATWVTVTVVIQPVNETGRAMDVPVRLIGVPDGWTADMQQESAVVTITGEESWVDGLTADQISLVCDVTGLAAGAHEVPLQCSVTGGEERQYLIEAQPAMMPLTLTAPQE